MSTSLQLRIRMARRLSFVLLTLAHSMEQRLAREPGIRRSQAEPACLRTDPQHSLLPGHALSLRRFLQALLENCRVLACRGAATRSARVAIIHAAWAGCRVSRVADGDLRESSTLRPLAQDTLVRDAGTIAILLARALLKRARWRRGRSSWHGRRIRWVERARWRQRRSRWLRGWTGLRRWR